MSLKTSITTTSSGNYSHTNGATYRDSSLLKGNDNWIQPNNLTYTAATSYVASAIN